jgi:hypothetical protein
VNTPYNQGDDKINLSDVTKELKRMQRAKQKNQPFWQQAVGFMLLAGFAAFTVALVVLALRFFIWSITF